MKGAAALIRLSTYEVEVLQKRLAEAADRRAMAQAVIAALDEEAAAETARAAADAEAGWWLIGFRQGLKIRRERADAELATARLEEAGAREALTLAFEGLKKIEHVAELARVVELRAQGRRDGAALDELALRRRATG